MLGWVLVAIGGWLEEALGFEQLPISCIRRNLKKGLQNNVGVDGYRVWKFPDLGLVVGN